MLTNEYFGITIEMKNEFDMMLENVIFSLTIPAQYHNKGEIILLFQKYIFVYKHI